MIIIIEVRKRRGCRVHEITLIRPVGRRTFCRYVFLLANPCVQSRLFAYRVVEGRVHTQYRQRFFTELDRSRANVEQKTYRNNDIRVPRNET